jgi:hypothetical protein
MQILDHVFFFTEVKSAHHQKDLDARVFEVLHLEFNLAIIIDPDLVITEVGTALATRELCCLLLTVLVTGSVLA